MKRVILTLALCCAPVIAFAAQTPVTQIDKFNSAATKIDDVRVAANVRLAAAQSNFTEIYTALNGSPWLAQTTAPSIHNVFWLDTTGAPPTIKYWDGDSWEVAASGGDGTYTLPAASAETLGGIKVGDRLTMTDGVLSADVQTTDISGKQDTLVSGANIKTVNSTSLLGSGNIDISGSSVPDGTVNGQVLTWLTDQWVASTAPWLTTASLGTGVATALGFAPNTAGGFLLYSTYASDPLISWDTATIMEIENDPVAGTNTIGVKSGVFQSADPQLDTWAGVTPGNGISTAIAVNADTVGGLPVTIAKGSYTVDTTSIAANTCASAVAVTATGVATTDTIIASPSTILSSVVGFGVTTAGAVRVDIYPTSGNVNFQFCNPTGSAIDPGSVTFNWRVLR